jgi:hypothetical protein
MSNIHDFILNPTDPKATIIANTNLLMGGVNIVVMFYFYDSPMPPFGAFKDLLAI